MFGTGWSSPLQPDRFLRSHYCFRFRCQDGRASRVSEIFRNIENFCKKKGSELYFFRNWLQKHCNDEWNVHFKALLKRLRNSLTCEGGFRPDHALAPGNYKFF